MNQGELKGVKVSLAELAGLLGVTNKTVSRWIKQGMPIISKENITTKGYEIDSANAINWYMSNSNNKDQDLTLADLKKKKLSFDVDKAEIELLIHKNEIVFASEVLDHMSDCFTRVRQSFRNVPDKISAVVSIESDVLKCKEIIREELEYCLRVLSNIETEKGHIVKGENNVD